MILKTTNGCELSPGASHRSLGFLNPLDSDHPGVIRFPDSRLIPRFLRVPPLSLALLEPRVRLCVPRRRYRDRVA